MKISKMIREKARKNPKTIVLPEGEEPRMIKATKTIIKEGFARLIKLILGKQAADLCTNIFSQYVAYEYINGGYLDKQVQEIKKLYKRKRDLMLKALKKYFPKEAKWTLPKGGMFIWITLPKRVNTYLMLQKAIAKKVAYVSGDAFYPDKGNYNSMRLNFSYSEDEIIEEGIKRLADVIKDEIAASYKEEPVFRGGV